MLPNRFRIRRAYPCYSHLSANISDNWLDRYRVTFRSSMRMISTVRVEGITNYHISNITIWLLISLVLRVAVLALIPPN